MECLVHVEGKGEIISYCRDSWKRAADAGKTWLQVVDTKSDVSDGGKRKWYCQEKPSVVGVGFWRTQWKIWVPFSMSGSIYTQRTSWQSRKEATNWNWQLELDMVTSEETHKDASELPTKRTLSQLVKTVGEIRLGVLQEKYVICQKPSLKYWFKGTTKPRNSQDVNNYCRLVCIFMMWSQGILL